MKKSFQISIDTGGTFTDCIATDNFGTEYRTKILSNSTIRGEVVKPISGNKFSVKQSWQLKRDILTDYLFLILGQNFESKVIAFDVENSVLEIEGFLPQVYQNQTFSFALTAHEEAPILGVRLITETGLNEQFPTIQMRIGSTKGTNALLELKGAKTAFVVTKGFKDLLVIGNQARPDIFALNIIRPEPLHSVVVEIDEQIDFEGKVVKGIDLTSVGNKIQSLKNQGVESIAICLKNAHRNSIHEKKLQDLFSKYFRFINISTELSGQIKFINRAETTVVNAYLAPIISNYLQKITDKLPSQNLKVMTSSGSLVRSDAFYPKDSLFSGPAGGVVGASVIAQQAGYQNFIAFDMGGTSTDVARYDGQFEYQFSQKIGNAHIFSPSIAIETVAAGGGSICTYDGYKLSVGPDSAGSTPGPACYGAGGPFTITDVNLLLGRLDAAQFSIPVFPEKAEERLNEILQVSDNQISRDEILEGFRAIANEKMADTVRKISISKGYDTTDYALVAFGGAGGLHACGIANLLNIKTILLPKDAGILSAFGISQARIERFAEASLIQVFDENFCKNLFQTFEKLENEVVLKLENDGVLSDNIQFKNHFLYLRFKGQDSSLEIEWSGYEEIIKVFREKYVSIYGHWVENRDIEIESIRVIAGEKVDSEKIDNEVDEIIEEYEPKPSHFIQSFVENESQSVPVYIRENLKSGAKIKGFALLLDRFSTTVIEEGWEFILDKNGTGRITIVVRNEVSSSGTSRIGLQIFDDSRNAIGRHFISSYSNSNIYAELELFTNRFMSIAENMGVLLQRTSISVNVKERLDFSCALLDAEAELIANAPHIPVHLGSLGVCVRSVLQYIKIEKGDVVITNHPKYGGSHLPDITLISSVYSVDNQLIGYVVNRCHHSEIGGIRPASMPPNSTNLAEEGVVIPPMYLVKNGEIRWEEITQILTSAKYPTRSLQENLADLNAALAANRNGEIALQSLVIQHGLEKVHFYMNRLKTYSTEKMKQRLLEFGKGIYEAEELLDSPQDLTRSVGCPSPSPMKRGVLRTNGSPLNGRGFGGEVLKVKVQISDNEHIIDFTGSSKPHTGNLNANISIVNSVVVYVLRLLLNEKIPLNDGILKSVKIIIPDDSILNPNFPDDPEKCPAVVGGNVELSQRLTDTLLKAFGIVACSQGTMNNFLFGNDNFGYYETICGGSGASDGFHGTSGVHTHMTNTRITDPEVMELRYPVYLKRFEIRENSGGKGRYNGGDGIIREIEFLENVEVSLIRQHQEQQPYGLQGGENGKTGSHLLQKNDGTSFSANEFSAEKGDVLTINTPGGGGFGAINR